jgi:anti-anti-sigma factor
LTETFEGAAGGFSWKADAREGILTILLAGDLDLAVTSDSGKELTNLVARDERLVVVDLRAVDFMDSSGLRYLVTMRHDVENRGARFLLGELSPAVKRLFEVAGLQKWFEYLEGEAF